MNAGTVTRIVQDYGLELDRDQAEAVEHYVELLLHWNKRISLTAITEPEAIVRQHFGESLFALKAIPLLDGRLADVGSGAGFPGAALALLAPSLDVALIEPNAKKAAFLETIRGDLNLANVEVIRSRVEDCRDVLTTMKYVTTRAFGSYEQLLRLIRRDAPQLSSVVLWLGENDAKKLKAELGWSWRTPVPIPRSSRRVLLIGSPSATEHVK